MARPRFPFEDDVRVIENFLRRRAAEAEWSCSNGKTLKIAESFGAATVAWWSPTDGALWARITIGMPSSYAVALINAVAEMLGIEERGAIHPELGTAGTQFGDVIVGEEPFVLAGPLTAAAYRARPNPYGSE